MMRIVFAVFSVLVAGAPAAAAGTPKNVGAYEAWSVWTYTEKNRSRCFIYANPAKATPAKLDHGLVSFFVRGARRTEARSEASLQVGYRLKPGEEARLLVDGEPFRLITEDKGAWLAKGGGRERDLVEAMTAGRTMTVAARSARGNATRYVFPLAGVADAMKALRAACP